MTQLTTLVKQSYEERIFEFDLSGLMDDAATILASPVPVVTATLFDGSGSVTISGETPMTQGVKALFAGGVSGSIYKVNCKATDSDGQKLEWDGYLAVRDV